MPFFLLRDHVYRMLTGTCDSMVCLFHAIRPFPPAAALSAASVGTMSGIIAMPPTNSNIVGLIDNTIAIMDDIGSMDLPTLAMTSL